MWEHRPGDRNDILKLMSPKVSASRLLSVISIYLYSTKVNVAEVIHLYLAITASFNNPLWPKSYSPYLRNKILNLIEKLFTSCSNCNANTSLLPLWSRYYAFKLLPSIFSGDASAINRAMNFISHYIHHELCDGYEVDLFIDNLTTAFLLTRRESFRELVNSIFEQKYTYIEKHKKLRVAANILLLNSSSENRKVKYICKKIINICSGKTKDNLRLLQTFEKVNNREYTPSFFKENQLFQSEPLQKIQMALLINSIHLCWEKYRKTVEKQLKEWGEQQSMTPLKLVELQIQIFLFAADYYWNYSQSIINSKRHSTYKRIFGSRYKTISLSILQNIIQITPETHIRIKMEIQKRYLSRHKQMLPKVSVNLEERVVYIAEVLYGRSRESITSDTELMRGIRYVYKNNINAFWGNLDKYHKTQNDEYEKLMRLKHSSSLAHIPLAECVLAMTKRS